ncbi:hypothetical protein ABZ915_47840 [Streptomyces sp. NPDC046915]|uniref:hypothetical protein n=1 Tax=Streptomyces sp. NPDC046915 TaxID=3155257 RepID=UPI0033D0D5FD
MTVTFTLNDAGDTGTRFASEPVTALTGADGIATAGVTLTAGGTPGEVHVVAQAGTAVTAFGLHVGYTSIDELQIVGGDGQYAEPGTPFAQPLTVLALRGGQPVPSLPVCFHLVDLGGTGSTLGDAETEYETTTDSAGQARAGVVAGPGEGDIIVTATGADKTVTFHASVGDPVPALIVPEHGQDQEAQAGLLFPLPLTALVTSPSGAPAGGVEVEFLIEGNPTGSFFLDPGVPALANYLTPDGDGAADIARLTADTPQAAEDRQQLLLAMQAPGTSSTSIRVTTLDAPQDPGHGRATSPFIVAGPTAGTFHVRATIPDHPEIPPATYQLTVTPAPIRLVRVSGDGQTIPAGTRFPQPCVVRVTNFLGQSLEDIAVTFQLTGTTGAVFPDNSTSFTVSTDSNGTAVSRAITADFAGLVQVRATCPDVNPAPAPVRFGLKAT